MAKLFVYGTLQRGHRLHRVLEEGGAVFECKAVTVASFSMINGGWKDRQSIKMFPIVMRPTGNSPSAPIAGEVYQMPEHYRWDELDRIESMYDRVNIAADGEEPTYMYVVPCREHWYSNFTEPHADGKIYWLLPSK